MNDHVDVRTSLALGRQAATSADVAQLFSDEGVSLDLTKGDQQAVVVTTAPCCNHGTTRVVPAEQERPDLLQFNTAEHVIAVWDLVLKTEAGTLQAGRAGLPLSMNRPYTLSYGQIIALGGDFYGDPDQPVCTSPDPVGQFQKNFDTMAKAKAEVAKILAITNKYEFGPIAGAVRAGQQPSAVYAGLPTSPGHEVPDEDRAFDDATGGRYLKLSETNLDHFGVDALTCYTAGHLLAQRFAAKASTITDASARATALLVAYAINAFADHFITDLFSAGHMRTPRRPIYNSASTELTRKGAGICAWQMHNEDNKFGLWVTNDVGDRWTAYGDSRYRDKWNAAGRVVMKAAVQQSMNDVWDSFAHGKPVDESATGVIRYTAKVIREMTVSATARKHRDDPNNWAPLFWTDPDRGQLATQRPVGRVGPHLLRAGTVALRVGIASTVLRLRASSFQVYMPPRMYHQYPPVETGMTGEYGWPPIPGSMTGPYGATGPTLRNAPQWSWSIDGAPGPTSGPGPSGSSDSGAAPVLDGTPTVTG